ncbi:MAG TPA: polyprenyl diphosphate synthase [Candidatus Thermoplasmatota archaeon]|nr:polyprenyl diphosphate synthase [Candidatus Thermoplasmatota archaeon]
MANLGRSDGAGATLTDTGTLKSPGPVGSAVGERIKAIESTAGRKVDDLAKALLNYSVIRGPARRLANSKVAWAFVSRVDRIRERRLIERIKKAPVPHHVGIIMDGNRRFAKLLGLDDVSMGHVAGQERLENVLDWCLDLGIRVLTVYAFSTENFQRATPERELLMELFEHNFRKMAVDERVHKNKIRVRCIGDLELLPASVREAALHVMEVTKAFDGYTFNVAVAYGGRQEIVDAVRRIAVEAKTGVLDPATVTADTISRRLYTGDLPDPDFIIRTSGEERVSNFLLWQMAYAELYFCDVNWPELDRMEFLHAIFEYQRRKRRYGT